MYLKLSVDIIYFFTKSKMIKHYTRTLLLSSRFISKQLTILPLNKFVTYKTLKPVSSRLLLNKNVFLFA